MKTTGFGPLFSCMPIPHCIAPQIRLHGLGRDAHGAFPDANGFQIAAFGELADGLLGYREKLRGLSDSDIAHV